MIKVFYQVVDAKYREIIHVSAVPRINDTIVIDDELYVVMGVIWEAGVRGIYEPIIGLDFFSTEK